MYASVTSHTNILKICLHIKMGHNKGSTFSVILHKWHDDVMTKIAFRITGIFRGIRQPVDSPHKGMMTSSNGSIFRVTGHLSPVTGEFPAQRPVTRSFDVFFDLRLNKRLGKQSWGWWFETPSRPLWRHWGEALFRKQIIKLSCGWNDLTVYVVSIIFIALWQTRKYA